MIPEESSSCGVNEFVATALEPVIEETDSFEPRLMVMKTGGLEHNTPWKVDEDGKIYNE